MCPRLLQTFLCFPLLAHLGSFFCFPLLAARRQVYVRSGPDAGKVGIVQEAVHGVDTPAQLDDLNEQVRLGKVHVPSLTEADGA